MSSGEGREQPEGRVRGTGAGRPRRIAGTSIREAPPAPPKTDRGRRTRELIVDGARRVFEKKGFLDTRIADIASASGISHGTFYTYFQTKEEVFREIMVEVAEAQYKATEIPAAMPHDPQARIEYSIRHYLRSYREMSQITGVIEQVAILDEDFRRARLEIRREFRDRIEHGLRRMQATGMANPELPARAAAEAITSMLSNFAYVTYTLGEDHSEDDAVAALTQMWASGIGLTRPA